MATSALKPLRPRSLASAFAALLCALSALINTADAQDADPLALAADQDERLNASALLIAVGNYRGDWGDLRSSAANDLILMSEALVAAGYDPESIVIVTDDVNARSAAARHLLSPEAITTSTVAEALSLLAANDSDDAMLFVYLSGHGSAGSDLNRYLALHESLPSEWMTLLPLSSLVTSLSEKAPHSRKFIVVDACADGPADPVNRHVHITRGVEMLFSSRLGQRSQVETFAGGRPASVFTKYLSDALRQIREVGNRNDELTTNELFDHVQRKMSEHWRQRNASLKGCDRIAPAGLAPPQCPESAGIDSFPIAGVRQSWTQCAALRADDNESLGDYIQRLQQCEESARE